MGIFSDSLVRQGLGDSMVSSGLRNSLVKQGLNKSLIRGGMNIPGMNTLSEIPQQVGQDNFNSSFLKKLTDPDFLKQLKELQKYSY